MIDLADKKDIAAVARTYHDLLTYEAEHGSNSNWALNVYPTQATAEKAEKERTLYVLREGGAVVASVILNGFQPKEYKQIDWLYPAEDSKVFVIHTLCVPPQHAGKRYGHQMVRFAVQKAKELGCEVIRLDTWAENKPAAALYAKLGFRYAGTTDVLLQGLIPEKQIFFEIKLEEMP